MNQLVLWDDKMGCRIKKMMIVKRGEILEKDGEMEEKHKGSIE